MKIGILGGGSCFALNLANLLQSRHIDHFGIGRSGEKSSAFWVVDHRYRYYQGHVVDQIDTIMGILMTERPDVIVNIAAQGEGAQSFKEYAPDFFRTNTYGLSRLVVELMDKAWLKRFIQIGTSELYGSTEKPAKETAELKPTSPYAISKAAFDQYLLSMFKFNAFPMNIIRPSNCYTPGQQLYRVIPKAIVCALSGKKLRLEGGGRAKKSYLHATDLSRAILDVVDKAPLGKVYNVAPASPVAIRTVVAAVAEACNVQFEELIEDVPDRLGQDSIYHLDATEIARDCGWTQTINLGRGLDTMVEWVKKNPELLTLPTNYEHRT